MTTNRDRTRKRALRSAAGFASAGLISLILAVPASAVGQSQTWNTFLGGPGWDTGRGAAVDASGNVYVSGTADGTWGAPVRAYSAKNDVFVAKLDKNGKLLWNTFLGGAGIDNGSGITLDPNGGIYVAGTSDLSWGKPVTPLAGGTDAFVAKLDQKGNILWNTFVGGSGLDQAAGVAVDADGSARIVGSSDATWGTPEGEYWASADGFAARLDPDGALLWNTFLGGIGEDYARGVVIGADGYIYAVGTSTDTWGGAPIRGYTYYSDAWAAKVDEFGHLAWNSFIGGEGYDSGFGIAVDAASYVYMTGTSNTSWGDPVVALTSGYDAFATKLDPDGNVVWNTFIGGDGKNFGKNIFIDEFGYITVVGYGLGTWQTPLSDIVGGYDIFLCKLDNDGNFDWLTFVGGTGDDYAEAAASGPDRGICIVGVSDADWGTPLRPYSANYDAFVAWVPETPEGAGTVEASAPAQGTVILPGKSPEFAWEARGPVAFRLEFSNRADFETPALVLPARGGWLATDAYAPAAAEMDSLRRLTVAGQVLYWRVRGRMADGSEIVSAVRWFIPRASR
jgi:hypothetical protein